MSAEPQADDERPTGDDVPERFVPEQMRGELVSAEHLARYRWAAAFCSGRRVLDAGCGAGYGSELLNQAGAEEVVAIDVSEAALELARAAVTEGVICERGDVTDLAYENGAFDLVVCFEVIEHVDDPERVLDELKRVLKPDGLLVVSSPNRDRYVPGNPFHRHEFTRSELQEALDARFESARIISQHAMLASVISWGAGPLFESASTERTAVPEPADEIYLLAMAGDDLPPDPGPVVALGLFAEPRRWLEHIAGQQHMLEKQDRHLRGVAVNEQLRLKALGEFAAAQQELTAARAQRAALAETRRALEAAEERLEALAEELRDTNEREASLTVECGRLRAQLRSVASSKSWRVTAPLRRLTGD